MCSGKLPLPRFSLASLFVLMLGIAIGYSLNWYTLVLMVGPPNKARMTSLPPYVIDPPDILRVDLIEGDADSLKGVSGNHLVGPDGRVYLGKADSVYVAGQTVAEAQESISQLVTRLDSSAKVLVDIYAYNSKKYYVIFEGPNGTGNVVQASVTGNETDPAAVGGARKLPVDWNSIATGASPESNYQLMPGDRLFISQSAVKSAN